MYKNISNYNRKKNDCSAIYQDAIDRAIEKGKHNSVHTELTNQTWEQFDEAVRGKNLFLFGVGESADLFWKRSAHYRELKGVIDNDESKKGQNAGWYIADINAENYVIEPADYLNSYISNRTVVLISSINYYDDIADQLFNLGIKNVYSLLIMEANWRNTHGKDEYCISQQEYAEKCRNIDVNRNKIVFCQGYKYKEHGKYIAESLLKAGKGVEIVWILDDMNVDLPKGMRGVYVGNWKRVYYEIASAGIYITSSDVPLVPQKKDDQIYIHTKHWASVTLKKFYLDATNITIRKDHAERLRQMVALIDYILVGSDFDEESCRRGFLFDGDCIRVGSPRSDALFRKETIREKVCSAFDIPRDKKILTYAPTYRYRKDITDKNVFEARDIGLDFLLLKNTLERRFEGEWTILLRLHPGVTQYADLIETDTFVKNVSDWQDGEEIVAASDILISDYSSIMFEPAFVKTPVFLFAMDKQEYVNKEYDLLIDYDTLPFPIAETNEQLVDNIMSFDQKKYEADVTAFLDKYGVHEDGHASERAAEFILGLMG